MINYPILINLLNNVDRLCAYDIDCTYHKVTFCTPLESEPEVYNIFGFCNYRLSSYNFKTYIFYVIQ